MKVILVNPPARSIQHESIVVPPLGLMYLAAVLRRAGIQVSLKDAFAEGMTWRAFEAFIKYEKPDVFGIGGMSPVIDTSFRAIKMARPHVRHVIMGGPHASLFKEKIFEQCPEVDFLVCGEGEITAVELIKAIQSGQSGNTIDGVITRSSGGHERLLIKDIDSLPYPDRSVVPNHLYRYPLSKHSCTTTIFSSRGCPYACTFCDKSTFGSVWRARSAENVLGECDEILHHHGIKSVIFYDDLFTVQKERVAAICEGILSRGWKLDWKCEGRVNLADIDLIKLMRRAGCSLIAYGVESGNQAGLDYLNKRTNPDQIARAFDLTRKAGIRTMAYFILGIPVETYEDEIRTIEFAKKIRPTYAQFSILSPYYGTKVYDEAVAKGWYREIDAQNPMDKDLKRPVILSENWNEDQLRKIIREAHRRFYFRPGYVLSYLTAMQGLGQLWNAIGIAFRMAKWFGSSNSRGEECDK
jgi:radical SAM superfamily enzyme YgiQ (UPF0313 family)